MQKSTLGGRLKIPFLLTLSPIILSNISTSYRRIAPRAHGDDSISAHNFSIIFGEVTGATLAALIFVVIARLVANQRAKTVLLISMSSLILLLPDVLFGFQIGDFDWFFGGLVIQAFYFTAVLGFGMLVDKVLS